MRQVAIGGRSVGPGAPVFLIAEAGVNHNGDIDLAHRMVDAAAAAGVDAVKFQVFRADRVISPNAPKAQYQLETTDAHESQLDMIRGLELPLNAFRDLAAHCHDRSVMFLATPFDVESADLLQSLNVAAYKIPSGEITNLPYLQHVSAKGRPLLMSTGMAWLGEIEVALQTVRACGNDDIVLLHCVSAYPAPASSVNLRAMATIASAFDVPVGYSDHTEGVAVPLAAVALGACVIEKHFTLDRTLPGPDHRASLEPAAIAELVLAVRDVERALGTAQKRPADVERDTAAVARRSLVAAHDIEADTVLTSAMVELLRPGTGLPASAAPFVIGRRVRRAVPQGTVIQLDMLA